MNVSTACMDCSNIGMSNVEASELTLGHWYMSNRIRGDSAPKSLTCRDVKADKAPQRLQGSVVLGWKGLSLYLAMPGTMIRHHDVAYAQTYMRISTPCISQA